MQKDCDVFIADMPKETSFFISLKYLLCFGKSAEAQRSLVSLGLGMYLHVSALITSTHSADTCILPHKIPAN